MRDRLLEQSQRRLLLFPLILCLVDPHRSVANGFRSRRPFISSSPLSARGGGASAAAGGCSDASKVSVAREVPSFLNAMSDASNGCAQSGANAASSSCSSSSAKSSIASGPSPSTTTSRPSRARRRRRPLATRSAGRQTAPSDTALPASAVLAEGTALPASAASAEGATPPTPTHRSTSHKFKNVEEMLDSFRGADPVLIAFTAVNCGPCRLQKKELAEVRREMVKLSAPPSPEFVAEAASTEPSPLKMVSIDTGKWPSVGSKFRVGKLPCLVVMQSGSVKYRLEGFTKAEDVVKHIRTLL